MTSHAKIDFPALIEPVARIVWGTPNKQLSRPSDIRWGNSGSRSVDPKKGVWHDHESGEGGGCLDLIAREMGLKGRDAIQWMRLQGLPVSEVPTGTGPETQDPWSPSTARPTIVETYDYRDEEGRVLYQVCRLETTAACGEKPKKTFRQRRPNPERPDDWIWSIEGVRRVPYRLQETLEALAAQTPLLFICEGERKVDALAKLGVPATCNMGGSGKWLAEWNPMFRGADVVILPDNDPSGHKHAQAIIEHLKETAERIRILELPGLPAKGDIIDWLREGGTAALLYQLLDSTAVDWQEWRTEKVVSSSPQSSDIELSEDACALSFVEQRGASLRYDHDASSWYVWNGKCWSPDATALAFNYARSTIRDAASSRPQHERKSAGRAAFAAGVERFAQSDERVAVRSDIWNRNSYLLGTPSGTIDLKTGSLVQARPLDYITRTTAVVPADAPSCPNWLRFLTEATGNDPQVIRFLQCFSGYCLTSETSEHALLFIYGDGGTGKTTFVKTLLRLLGDYAVQAAMETFTARAFDRHPEELASLAGSRLVVASETEEGRRWSEARVKQLTGGDPIRARFMRQNSFQFQPSFKLLFCGNHAPHINNLDEAMRRRFNIVPFETRPKSPDPHLEQKLEAEWPGILRWAIDGCLAWQRDGLIRPEAVVSATADYFSGQDTFTTWLEERCEIERGNDWKRESSAELFASWSAYAKAAGEEAGSRKSFGDRMRRKGFITEQIKAFNAKGFKGICLRRQQTEWEQS